MSSETKMRLPLPTLRALWLGRGRPIFRLKALFSGLLFLGLARFGYEAALWTARWSYPTAFVGLILLGVALVLVWFGLRQIWLFIAHLGLRGVLALLVLPVLGIYIWVGLVLANGLGWQGWQAVAVMMGQQSAERVAEMIEPLMYVPDDVALAFSGRDLRTLTSGDVPHSVPGAPTTIDTGQVAEVISTGAILSPTTASESAGERRDLMIGDRVQVMNTGGAVLRARAAASTSAPITVRFLPDTYLEIVDGPTFRDGYTWWYVRGDDGEGWCAAEFLELMASP